MDGEADLTWVLAHDLDSNNGRAHHSVRRIGAIGKGTLYEREELARGLKQPHRTITILDRGAVSVKHERPTIGVDKSVALATLDLLAGIIAPRPASLGRL